MTLFATVSGQRVEPLDPVARRRLGAVPTANIGDAMSRLGIVDPGIRPIWTGAACVGTAHTVWTRAGDNRAIHEALETVRPGDVIVVNGQSDERRALIGELIAGRAKVRGATGFVIDGAVRDAPGLREYGMPVFARAETAAGPYKDGPGVVGATIAVGGVPVHPGDVVVGDSDGVVIVPRIHLDEVIAGAEAKRDAEARTRLEIEAGMIGRGVPVDSQDAVGTDVTSVE